MKRQLRGVLVAVHLVAITVGSLPVIVDERALTPEAWNEPVAQQEFQRFSQLLAGSGIQRSPAQVGEDLWKLASGVLHAQRFLQRPFQSYCQEAGTRQRWRMFPGAVEETPRFRIEVDRQGNGAWELWYAMGDPVHNWEHEHFDRDRVRAALNLYAWGLYPESYEEMVDWIAARVPGTGRVRVGFDLLPAIGPDGRPASRTVREIKLARIRSLPFHSS